MKRFEFLINKEGNYTEVKLKGDLVIVNAFDLKDALSSLVNKNEKIKIDITNLGYISKVGIMALKMVKNEVIRKGARFLITDNNLKKAKHIFKLRTQQSEQYFYAA